MKEMRKFFPYIKKDGLLFKKMTYEDYIDFKWRVIWWNMMLTMNVGVIILGILFYILRSLYHCFQ